MGSGKDTVVKLLDIPRNYKIIDADAIGHDLLGDHHIIRQIKEFFPTAIENQVVNRSTLAQLVFPNQVKILNNIMHSAMIARIKSMATGNAIINAALLDELEIKKMSDKIVFVSTSTDETVARLKDKFSKLDILNRLNTQNPISWYNSQSDITIENNGSIEDLKKELAKKCQNLF